MAKTFISTTVTIIEENELGNLSIIESKTSISPLTDLDNDSDDNDDNIIHGGFIVSDSQIKYHYIAFGKNSPIQLKKYTQVKVAAEWCSEMTLLTHKTQQNRIDKMSAILNNVNVGDFLKVEYNPITNVLFFSKKN